MQGLWGGATSEVTENTTTILLESATFNKATVRMGSKKLGLRSESSSRFEKGLDPNQALEAINRAAQLIEELGAGEVVPGVVDQYPVVKDAVEIPFTQEGINHILGTTLSMDQMKNYLEKVECIVDVEKGLVKAPTFRVDLEREVDLAEEVARLYGYNEIPVVLNSGTPTVGKLSFKQNTEKKVKQSLQGMGYCEVYTYSFESPKVFDKINVASDSALREAVTLVNPLGEDYSMMRTTPLPGLLQVLSTNYNRRIDSVSLFEFAKVYVPKALPLKELPQESVKLTLGTYGKTDFYEIKGALDEVFEILGVEKVEYSPVSDISYLHPGRSAVISIAGIVVGEIGEVHPTVLGNYSIKERAYVAMVDFDILMNHVKALSTYESLPKYPAMSRDIAMLVKDEVLVKEMDKVISQRSGNILESFTLFDVYKGSQIQEGYKSVAYSLTFRAKDRTLTDDEVNKVMKKVLNGLETVVGAQLR